MPSAGIEAAIQRWQHVSVAQLVGQVEPESRVLVRLEAARLADVVRACLAAEALPVVVGVNDAAASLRLAVQLRASLVEAVADEASLAAGATALAGRAIDYRIEQLGMQVANQCNALEDTLVSFRGLFASLRDGLVFVDPAGIVVDVNASIVEHTGAARDEIVGQPFLEVWPPAPALDWRPLYEEVLLTGRVQTLYNVCYTPPKRGEELVFDLVVAPRVVGGRTVGTVSIVHYRTAQRALEQKLRRADRMASIGRLAAGVAHEFRNLIAGIRAVAELGCEADLAQSQRSLKRIVEVADRARDVTDDLLSFSRRMRPRIEPTDLEELLRATAELGLRGLGRVGGETIEVVFELAGTTPQVACDAGQVQQALLNLVINAVTAMGSRGGTLKLGAGPRGTQHVELWVEDNGPGIEPACRDRVFEPFFSEQRDDFGERKGTGLGLWTAKGIVERHGGTLVLVDSALGDPVSESGCRFVVSLPLRPPAAFVSLAEQACLASPRATTESAPGLGSLTAPVRVLVVDDDDVLRQVLSDALTRAGGVVDVAGTLAEAQELLKTKPFDAMLLDLIVPGLHGFDVLKQLREDYPSVPVAVVTGQTLADSVLAALLDTVDGFIEKPFVVGEVIRTVQLLCSGPMSSCDD